MSRRFLYLALVASTACVVSTEGFCSSGPTSLTKSVLQGTPTPTPTPTPAPTPLTTPTPDPCRIDSMTLDFKDGSDPFLQAGAATSRQLDLTPYNSSGQVAVTCNVVRNPTWATKTPAVCIVVGGGYNPFLEGLRIGTCTIEAMLISDNRPVVSSFSPEVR